MRAVRHCPESAQRGCDVSILRGFQDLAGHMLWQPGLISQMTSDSAGGWTRDNLQLFYNTFNVEKSFAEMVNKYFQSEIFFLDS